VMDESKLFTKPRHHWSIIRRSLAASPCHQDLSCSRRPWASSATLRLKSCAGI